MENLEKKYKHTKLDDRIEFQRFTVILKRDSTKFQKSVCPEQSSSRAGNPRKMSMFLKGLRLTEHMRIFCVLLKKIRTVVIPKWTPS